MRLLKNIILKALNPKIEQVVKGRFYEHGLIPVSQTEEEDVFMVGFPKSGNTWMQHLISTLILKTDSDLISDYLVQDLVPDLQSKSFYKRYFNRMFFKSHALPQPQYRKVIYIVRDGRDAMASYYHMNKNLNKQTSLDKMIFEQTDVYPCSWWDHVKAWEENPYDSDILFIKYEDLKTKPLEILKQVCDFSDLEVDQQTMSKAIEQNAFDKLKSKAREKGMDHPWWRDKKQAQKFFRKGVVGDYKNVMTADQIEFFNRIAKDQLARFHYSL